MRIRKTQAAAAAERHILARLYNESPEAAARLAARLDAATALLGRFPQLGRSGQRPGTRELVVAGTPYIIVYRLLERSVEILDIRHSARAS